MGRVSWRLKGNKRKPSDYTGRFHDDWYFKRENRGHLTRFTLGMPTDDSEMTTIMLSLVIRQDIMPNSLVREFMVWANSDTKPLGTNTRQLFHGYKDQATYTTRFKKRFPTEERREQSQSNGHLMRCSPIAFIDRESQRERAVAINTEVSNPSTVCYEVEMLYIKVLRMCLVSQTPVVVTRQLIRSDLEAYIKHQH